jgi:hypothetical protein
VPVVQAGEERQVEGHRRHAGLRPQELVDFAVVDDRVDHDVADVGALEVGRVRAGRALRRAERREGGAEPEGHDHRQGHQRGPAVPEAVLHQPSGRRHERIPTGRSPRPRRRP